MANTVSKVSADRYCESPYSASDSTVDREKEAGGGHQITHNSTLIIYFKK